MRIHVIYHVKRLRSILGERILHSFDENSVADVIGPDSPSRVTDVKLALPFIRAKSSDGSLCPRVDQVLDDFLQFSVLGVVNPDVVLSDDAETHVVLVELDHQGVRLVVAAGFVSCCFVFLHFCLEKKQPLR